MSRQSVFDFCLRKPGARMDEPWEGDQVAKVHGFNTSASGGAISDAELKEAIETSYTDVIGRLPKSERPEGA